MRFHYVINYQYAATDGTNPANEYVPIGNPTEKMKMLSDQLKQAFNALEFANAGHLHALTAKLNQPERSIVPARTEHHQESAAHDTGWTAFSN